MSPAHAYTCVPCSMAAGADRGAILTSLKPEILHAQCEAPGGCQCGCEYSKGKACRECGRARRAADLDFEGLRCSDRSDCANAIVAALLDGRTPPQTRAFGTNTSPPRTIAEIAAAGTLAPTTKYRGSTRECECGCGAETRSTWAPGHDARHAGKLIRAARAGDSDALAELNRRWPSKVPADLRGTK